LRAGTKAKSVTSNLPILSVLAAVIFSFILPIFF
jgi:fucose 4-O-acetylase-like acetyltransferase